MSPFPPCGSRRTAVEGRPGLTLRVLSAWEVLEARREGRAMEETGREAALCANACLLARALERTEDHSPVFADGRAVLAGLTVEEIAALAGRWSRFCRAEDPGPDLSEEELENVKKNSAPSRESGCGGGC